MYDWLDHHVTSVHINLSSFLPFTLPTFQYSKPSRISNMSYTSKPVSFLKTRLYVIDKIKKTIRKASFTTIREMFDVNRYLIKDV